MSRPFLLLSMPDGRVVQSGRVRVKTGVGMGVVDRRRVQQNVAGPRHADLFDERHEKQVREVRRLYECKSVTVDRVAAMMGVGRSTVYRCLSVSDNT